MATMSVVVFDMDGTLTDTEALWDVVRREVAASEGLTWPEDATQAMMGMATQQWAAYMVEAVGLPGTAEQAAERIINTLAEHYRDRGVPLLPGAAAAVRRISTRWRLGLASSSPRVLIDIALEQLGILDLIEVSLSTEEIGGAGKPAPDVYLEVCRRLGADPRRSVAIEDAPNGIRSAYAAGLAVVAIPPHFHPPSAEVLALAAEVVDSLDELSVERVASILEAR
jgi:HAD superfamily hydrolase (TIGR01509 family)